MHKEDQNEGRASHTLYEKITPDELARRWQVKRSWIDENIRKRCPDPIPYVTLGKYARFEWGSPQLEEWWARRRKVSRQEGGGELKRKERKAS